VPNRPRRADIRTALSLNAAFGGANTALVVERA
jgi:3-oxoacyl-[acyl-carrier-protein] synthase II